MNIALNKPATQSSTWAIKSHLYTADRAVDGSRNTFTNTAQDQHPSWWKVDLQDVYSIGRIVILAPVLSGSELSASLILYMHCHSVFSMQICLIEHSNKN